MKISNDTIGNQTRDSSAWSAVPQPHAHPSTLRKSSYELLSHNSIFRCYLRKKIRNFYVEKMSVRDSASTTKYIADFQEIRCRKSLQKLVGNYEFVKIVSVEVIFYLFCYKPCLSVICIFIK